LTIVGDPFDQAPFFLSPRDIAGFAFAFLALDINAVEFKTLLPSVNQSNFGISVDIFEHAPNSKSAWIVFFSSAVGWIKRSDHEIWGLNRLAFAVQLIELPPIPFEYAATAGLWRLLVLSGPSIRTNGAFEFLASFKAKSLWASKFTIFAAPIFPT